MNRISETSSYNCNAVFRVEVFLIFFFFECQRESDAIEKVNCILCFFFFLFESLMNSELKEKKEIIPKSSPTKSQSDFDRIINVYRRYTQYKFDFIL